MEIEWRKETQITRADRYEGVDLVRIVKIHANGKPSVIREFNQGAVHCTKFWKDDGSDDPNGVSGPWIGVSR
jgi:hypothetical protein